MSMSNRPSKDHELSEAEFLRLQAKLAKSGASRAIDNAKLALVGKADPRKMTRKHPILALISATIAGFVAAVMAIPSKEEQELRHAERLHRALHPDPPKPSTNGNGEPPKSAAPHSIWSTILHELIVLLKPILLASITAGVKSAVDRASSPTPNRPDDPTP